MMDELRPCPFCGSPAYSYHDNCIDFAGVKCDLGGCVCADILITENNWNTRPIEDALNKRIAELEEKQRWRVVANGELPEVYRDEDGEFIPFLVCEGDGDRPFIAMYGGTNWHAGIFVPDVTHWMPLPELPEVQE
jgi:hypothetical protein